MSNLSVREWIGNQHPLVRLYIYTIVTLFGIMLAGSIYFIVETKYLVACGACFLPLAFFGFFVGLGMRATKRRTPPGGYYPIEGNF